MLSFLAQDEEKAPETEHGLIPFSTDTKVPLFPSFSIIKKISSLLSSDDERCLEMLMILHNIHKKFHVPDYILPLGRIRRTG